MTKDQLLPASLRKCLPTVDDIAEVSDPIVQAKFFYPDFNWTWFAIAFDGDDIFYGLVDGFEREFGSFRLSELLATRGKLGCEIERDRYFDPVPVSKLFN